MRVEQLGENGRVKASIELVKEDSGLDVRVFAAGSLSIPSFGPETLLIKGRLMPGT